MQPTEFRTSETALAAYLSASGVTRLDIDYSDPQHVVFVFEAPPDTVLLMWHSGRENVNAQTLITAYKECIRITRRDK